MSENTTDTIAPRCDRVVVMTGCRCGNPAKWTAFGINVCDAHKQIEEAICVYFGVLPILWRRIDGVCTTSVEAVRQVRTCFRKAGNTTKE